MHVGLLVTAVLLVRFQAVGSTQDAVAEPYECDASIDYAAEIDAWQEEHFPGYDKDTSDQAAIPALRDQLLEMMARDQAARVPPLDDSAMRAVDTENLKQLKEILAKYGLPTDKMVGSKAANAVFLLVQHAPHLAFQKSMLPRFREAGEKSEIKFEHYAFLKDRIEQLEGWPQTYGTQFRCGPESARTGRLEPFPIAETDDLDALRLSVGLYPMRLYACALEQDLDVKAICASKAQQ